MLLFISIGSIGFLPLRNVKAQWNPSYYQSATLTPNQLYNYSMPPNFSFFEFNIISNVSVDLTAGFEGAVSFLPRQIYVKINSSTPVKLNVTARFDYESFLDDLPEDFNLTDILNAYSYNCFYQFHSNSSISNISIYFRMLDGFGFDLIQNYTLGIYKNSSGIWSESGISLIEVTENGQSYLKASLTDVENDTDYYITPYTSTTSQQPSKPPVSLDWLFVLIPGIIVVAILSLVIAKKDYVKYLKRRIVSIDKGAHRLTMDEVLENKNRSKIIDIILKNPGIHFNELKRESGLASGNLVWHLDILETYKVIKKKRVKNYVIYIPYYSKNPLSNVDLKLQKSELTLEVLEMIEENPGIWNGKITDELETHRKTIQYHIDKLIDLGLIHKERDGIKKRIYPNLDAEYFKDNIEKQDESVKER